MTIEKALQDIGLTKNEVKIYLSLLDFGTTSTGPIIKKTGIHTSKVYDGLERLIEKGLATYIVKSNVKHFKAVDPKRLLDYLSSKRKMIDKQEEKVKDILPELELKRKFVGDDTEAEIFKGWKGMDTAYKLLRSSLRRGDVNYVFGAGIGEDKEKTRKFFNKHVKQLMSKGIKQRIIYNENARGNIEESYKYPSKSQVRFLEQTTPAEINIWADKVMIVILRSKPTVILVSDKKVAESFRQYFEIMWKLSKK